MLSEKRSPIALFQDIVKTQPKYPLFIPVRVADDTGYITGVMLNPWRIDGTWWYQVTFTCMPGNTQLKLPYIEMALPEDDLTAEEVES